MVAPVVAIKEETKARLRVENKKKHANFNHQGNTELPVSCYKKKNLSTYLSTVSCNDVFCPLRLVEGSKLEKAQNGTLVGLPFFFKFVQ